MTIAMSDDRLFSVVLDPTELYDIPAEYTPISTEVEWLEHVGITSNPLWIRGEFLYKWTREWLRVWNRTDAIVEIKQPPRDLLAELFKNVPIPEQWSDRDCLEFASQIDPYSPNAIACFLAKISDRDLDFWSSQASVEHLAEWLCITIPERYRPFEKVWQQQYESETLGRYYQTENKVQLLRQWLKLADPPLAELGNYPQSIPEFLQDEFNHHWERQIYRSEAAILDTLNFGEEAGSDRISQIAYRIICEKQHGEYLTRERLHKIEAYLNPEQRDELRSLQAPPQPEPLDPDATPEEVLNWTINEYLPFRRWETIATEQSPDRRTSDRLAVSFVEWIYQHYPQLKITPVADSFLNYNVTHIVRELAQNYPVLWVVIDGLGWLDHQFLVEYLTARDLHLETAIVPRFSILPTTTEFAKWGLYAQLTPRSQDWDDNIDRAFATIGVGQRYTDRQESKLKDDLSKNTHRLYCWDTVELDKLYHQNQDWQLVYQTKRPNRLREIGDRLIFYLQQYPEKEQVKIVISSDHGQLFGGSSKYQDCPTNLEPRGRMAKGKTDDPKFLVLSGDRFDLPYDISVVKGSESLNGFNYSQNQAIIGSHGGLFPEEVVIGYSVLSCQIRRSPIFVNCRGQGKAQESGTLHLSIKNPNPVPLTDLCLYVNELEECKQGKAINGTVSANSTTSLTVCIDRCPELPPNASDRRLALSGRLDFKYANVESASSVLDSEAAIAIEQIFSSGGINLDDF
ncbi:hypothetical protein [Oxynema aestuarii]|uniref:PglZ domain-containing protein n=1 Tax=Oxynema aestuarii AP17 TaxID=2064643 RepID=A0A6H1U2E2_9CYAN|nr:hypothetical protein [Oxynema aestuarii]QIZ72616.1 hypothetical protein HCG48_20140 [Oxynema aestuarii AP17]